MDPSSNREAGVDAQEAAVVTARATAELVRATWFLGLVTIALGFTAVFGDWLKGLLFRPRLRVETRNEPPYCLKIPLTDEREVQYLSRDDAGDPVAIHVLRQVGVVENYQLRMRVTNEGNLPAEDLELFASELRRLSPGGGYEPYREFLPGLLQWTYRVATLPRLLPKQPAYCDIAHIIKPEQRNLPYEQRSGEGFFGHETILSLSYASTPTNLAHLLPPGDYELDVQIGASNMAKPIAVTVRILLSGRWSDDQDQMLKDGVQLNIV